MFDIIVVIVSVWLSFTLFRKLLDTTRYESERSLQELKQHFKKQDLLSCIFFIPMVIVAIGIGICVYFALQSIAGIRYNLLQPYVFLIKPSQWMWICAAGAYSLSFTLLITAKITKLLILTNFIHRPSSVGVVLSYEDTLDLCIMA